MALKTIVVTGARGMLGCHVVPHLRACGHEVAELSRTTPVTYADLADPAATDAALTQLAPAAIVNLAALANVDECESSPQRAYLANTRTVENLASWARAHPASRLIHISTDQVYDDRGPHSEENVTLTNYYAFSKYAGELAAIGAGATVLRLNFFGRSKCAGRASFSDWIVQSLRAGAQIPVFEDVQFSPLSLDTLVRHIERCVQRPQPGVFNLGASDGMSKADFAFAVARVLRLPTASMRRVRCADATLRAYRPKDMRMSVRRFERAYDVRLPTLLEEIQSLGVDHGS